MSRTYTQLRAFILLDELVVDLYVLSRLLPDSELYGLQAQMRRAAVSAPTNIVEGSVRRSDKVYLAYLKLHWDRPPKSGIYWASRSGSTF
jgi:23S rRNA-intervening sequence protein